MLGWILLLFDFFRARWRKGPRPLVVHFFAVFWLATGLWSLFTTLPAYSLWEQNEGVVIFAFSGFTITLIPVVAIWGFSNRFARMLVTIVAAPTILIILIQLWSAFSPDPFEPLVLAHSTGMLAATLGLFHPSARIWFANKKELPDPQLDF